MLSITPQTIIQAIAPQNVPGYSTCRLAGLASRCGSSGHFALHRLRRRALASEGAGHRRIQFPPGDGEVDPGGNFSVDTSPRLACYPPT